MIRVEPHGTVVDIVCYPSQPVKAWEMEVVYDPGILRVVDIQEGMFFDGYLRFPAMGNTSAPGRITRLYDLIVGQGNVSSTGILCTITFIAQNNGTTNVTLEHAGVCNETGYLPLLVINGSMTVKSWSSKGEGWSVFSSNGQISEGWDSFENDVVLTRGWSRFLVTPGRSDPWDGVVAAAILIGFGLVAIVLMFKRR